MKKKYTKEQLEFYFEKLMKRLGRVPTIEDMENAKDLPSASIYMERFGSWENIKKKIGNKELNIKKCEFCEKTINFKKKSKRFCSAKCSKKFLLREKQSKIPPKNCAICNREFRITEVTNFKKRKICNDKICVEKHSLSKDAKKYKKLTPTMKKKLFKLKGNKCNFCDFTQVLFFMTMGRHSDKKLVNMVKKKDFNYFLVCPNHKELIERRMMKL